MLRGTIQKGLKALADLILPRTCVVCGDKLLQNEEFLCRTCAENLPLTYFWTQKYNPMANRYNEKIESRKYEYANALYFYKEGYKHISKSVKYHANIPLGEYMGRALGRKLATCRHLDNVDMIIPVPLFKIRKFKRGYNQSEVIARALLEGWNAELESNAEYPDPSACRYVRTDILHRIRNTKTQTKLAMEQKQSNVAGAFQVDNTRWHTSQHTEATAPRHILLVDDVFTSGSTLAECQKAVRSALIEHFGEEAAAMARISIATLAFVGD